MRVIAGSCGSLPLKTPPGYKTRPTSDRVKETLFNIINPLIADSVVLDLFAGSGSLGIEALSRGARFAYFVEKSGEACRTINENLEFTGLFPYAKVIRRDVAAAIPLLAKPEQAESTVKFDIVFIDPPYQGGYEKKVLSLLIGQTYISNESLIILEVKNDNVSRKFLPHGFVVEREMNYGSSQHLFIRKG
ncbi:MAG: 16S rRNA (guanine(966)-N(2))-methyltransferase RsmD [Lachnospiraceae bacterium]|jgi:16S rRNA (guanine966-N2)-methyltransferase|nr:16S rRNA (guanine(966)-N(2))-methyltransferase RsmD [Lachnospiraceae bacterium]